MDYLRIIENEGYRLEDLNNEHRNILKWLNYLLEDFENCFEANLLYYGEEEMSTLEKIEAEIAHDVIEEAIQWMRIQIAEYQISFAENEEPLEENDLKSDKE